jgi:hypothetical protein
MFQNNYLVYLLINNIITMFQNNYLVYLLINNIITMFQNNGSKVNLFIHFYFK